MVRRRDIALALMIRTRGLTKKYGSHTVLDHIDLDVGDGDMYGFLGANGSGKTTTVRALLGLVLPTSGSIELFGHRMPGSAPQVLGRIGTLIETPAAYGHLSGPANLSLFDASGNRYRGARRSRRARRVAQALDQVGLTDAGRRPVKAYSLGMRQRLGLAMALLHRPELLILDEPTNGLDPQGIREIRELLIELNACGTTILVSSHLLAEIEQTCTRVGVLDRGRLVLQDNLDSLRAPTGRTIVRTPDPARAVGILDGRVEQRDGDRLVVRGSEPAVLNQLLVRGGIPVTELIVERRSLEQVVLQATQNAAAPSTDTA